jgi:multicomponent Na+:H+ antiporter subunit G
MLASLATWIGGVVALPGALLMLAGALGVARLGDAYLRAHASSLVVSVGPALICLGLSIAAWNASASPRLLVLAGLCVALGPLLSHLAGAAVYASGVSPDRDARDGAASGRKP